MSLKMCLTVEQTIKEQADLWKLLYLRCSKNGENPSYSRKELRDYFEDIIDSYESEEIQIDVYLRCFNKTRDWWVNALLDRFDTR